MGASISSNFTLGTTNGETPPSSNSTPSTPAVAPNTTTNKPPPQASSASSSLPLKTPSRRSRRVTKSDPTVVNFTSNPSLPTPQLKHTPLSVNSRTALADKLTPARKSSRFTKFKMPKVQGAPKYSAKLSYEVDEMVYCWDKKLLYEARVEKREGNKYKVHFVGYKKGHDKWYTTDYMMGKDPKSNRYFREMWQRVQDDELGRNRR
eukprot:CAMPEP_0201731538 /NCGR_PEP_ID=MMETSP0593-20130828/26040_1 /ASSEMBLY_ACC=CAM_ASM_000672 /TAXON_ID=267983 /ORGANISM="Skeletonema japonicum, Strain CCMP2506" /LENGTH=205 /DNA_ID=CAMNT_0048224327 /DNA_START=182 /DNA_END=799 /DNA_ORIENTATION=-